MRGSLPTWAYRRLGRHYPAAFVALELQAGFLITAATVLLLRAYYEADVAEFGLVLAIALALTGIALSVSFLRVRHRIAPLKSWIAGYRDPESTARAWAAAVAMPLELVRRDMLIPVAAVVVPSCITAVLVLDLAWTAIFPLLAASLVAVGYSVILHYLTIEAGMRPVLVEINRAVPLRTRVDVPALPLRVRLLAALPLINVITGLVVAAITGEGAGGDLGLGFAILVAIGVATTISLELTVLLSRSILAPLADLQRATEEIRRGNFRTAVPVTTSDEIGELASSFNQMVEGLRERERIREAFGTYLDREVADYILSEGFSEDGFEADVTLMFCDVVGFTGFAAEAEAREVIGRLNALFDVVVPLIDAEGGHVDKFEGDGLMAVFGPPEGFPDHADRAVRAAMEINRRVNGKREGGGFEIGIGINTGSVVAGSVGGGGRLNFSVIGDAVNVAARVEGATRRTGDAVLLTEATRERLGSGFTAEPRGTHELKGLERPVELFAPTATADAPARRTLPA